jgi:hypothetical protein
MAAKSSNTHNNRAPIVLATPRSLANVHSSANTRYVTNKKMLDAQHRCALARQCLVTGSQIRLAIATLATPMTRLCSETEQLQHPGYGGGEHDRARHCEDDPADRRPGSSRLPALSRRHEQQDRAERRCHHPGQQQCRQHLYPSFVISASARPCT